MSFATLSVYTFYISCLDMLTVHVTIVSDSPYHQRKLKMIPFLFAHVLLLTFLVFKIDNSSLVLLFFIPELIIYLHSTG